MKNFFVKGLTGIFFTSLVSSTNNFCSASCREFPNWFYGEGEVPEDGAKWFQREFFVRVYNFMKDCTELGGNFNEENKMKVEKSGVNLTKFLDSFVVRNIDVKNFVESEKELSFLVDLYEEELWWIDGRRLSPITKSYYMNSRTDDQKKAADFIIKLRERWQPGSFGAGF